MCTLNKRITNKNHCNSTTTCIIYWHKYLHYWTSKDFDKIGGKNNILLHEQNTKKKYDKTFQSKLSFV